MAAKKTPRNSSKRNYSKKSSSAKKTVAKKSTRRAKRSSRTGSTDLFAPRKPDDVFAIADPELHVYGNSLVCSTNSRGHSTPGGRSPAELVLDASEGFIPLWAKHVTLRWRFNEASLRYFENIAAAMNGIRQLWGEAVMAWGETAPIKFTEDDDAWDFEIAVRSSDNCSADGCTLARAFFPDSGRHDLVLYPEMFKQPRNEQVETLIHEIGHVFGLRHFFADVSETAWPSVVFGAHKPFSIMNYGAKSVLTDRDKSDLGELYFNVWDGRLTSINSTRIVQVRPYHELGAVQDTIENHSRQRLPMSCPHNGQPIR